MPSWGEDTQEVQTLYLGGATGGTFTLGDGTTNTGAIAHNANAATIETELEGIFGAGDVVVAADTDFTITFALAIGDSGLEANFTSLSGTTDTPSLTIDQEHELETVLNVVQDSYGPPAASAGFVEIKIIPSPANLTPMTVLQQAGRNRETVPLECWVASQAEYEAFKLDMYAANVRLFTGYDGTSWPAVIYSMAPKRRVFVNFIEFTITFMEEDIS